MNKRIGVFYLVMLIVDLSWSQGVVPVSDTLIFSVGKLFYKHVVQKKQTLYSISKSYGVKIEDIQKANNLQNKDIKEGQILLIPAFISPSKGTILIAGEKVFTVDYHTVKKGDTYYKIAQQYDISINFLQSLNPDVNENALREGHVLLLAKPIKSAKQAEKSDQQRMIVVHEVSRGETLFSISRKYQTTVEEIKKLNPELGNQLQVGQKIKVPSITQETKKTNTCACSKINRKIKYEITILLPLSSTPASYAVPKENEDWEKPIEFDYIEFYQGFKLALDTLSSYNNSCTVKVLTVGNDTMNLQKKLKEKSIEKSDLIISLLSPEQNEIILEGDYLKNVPLAICNVQKNEYIAESHSQVVQLLTPVNFQFEALLSYLANNHSGSNIIFAYKGDENITELGKTFQELTLQNSFPVTIVDLNQSRNSAVFSKLNSHKENVLILIANNEFFVKEFLRQMFESYNKYPIVVFGLPTWLDFEFVEFDFMEKFNVHFFSSQFVDYNNYEVISFVKKFQERYKADPGRKAFIGYDLAIFFTRAINDYGDCYFDCLDKVEIPVLLSASFNFVRTSKGGWVNSGVQFYEMKNYYLWKK